MISPDKARDTNKQLKRDVIDWRKDSTSHSKVPVPITVPSP